MSTPARWLLGCLGFAVGSAVADITSVSPLEIGPGMTITVDGAGFGGTRSPQVHLVGVVGRPRYHLRVRSFRDDQVVASVPKGIPGDYRVEVKPRNGAAFQSFDIVTLTAPHVDEVVPYDEQNSGPGFALEIRGAGFGERPGTVRFGSRRVRVMVPSDFDDHSKGPAPRVTASNAPIWSNESIFVRAPAGMPLGPADVTVKGTLGTARKAAAWVSTGARATLAIGKTRVAFDTTHGAPPPVLFAPESPTLTFPFVMSDAKRSRLLLLAFDTSGYTTLQSLVGATFTVGELGAPPPSLFLTGPGPSDRRWQGAVTASLTIDRIEGGLAYGTFSCELTPVNAADPRATFRDGTFVVPIKGP